MPVSISSIVELAMLYERLRRYEKVIASFEDHLDVSSVSLVVTNKLAMSLFDYRIYAALTQRALLKQKKIRIT